jgi:hypothetical protein
VQAAWALIWTACIATSQTQVSSKRQFDSQSFGQINHNTTQWSMYNFLEKVDASDPLEPLCTSPIYIRQLVV